MLFLKTQLISLHILLHFFVTTGECSNLSVWQTPSVITALKGETVNINCSFSAGNVGQLKIKWKRNSTGEVRYLYVLSSNETNSSSSENRLTHVSDVAKNTSTLIIRDLHLRDSDLYICEVLLQIPPPIRKVQGKGTYLKVEARPRVELRAEVLPSPNGNKQLVCVSQEFYPPDIQISWFEDGKLITNETHNGTLQHNIDGSFSITSILKLSASDWNETKNYSCHVNHSTLSAPIIERISVNHHDPGNFGWLWMIITTSIVILVVGAVVVVALRKYSASKTKPPSPREITPKAEQGAREPVQEATSNEEFGIYTLLGQRLPLPV
ncbi:uncharacterized protein LOC103180135 isoform X1 [Callorhinchus milii]|uniref:Ig-like domain-containing protein n=1 Tax=Callorhinchus milii TaxID=7868 RepID=A0A4W3K8K6_CALMI|nr:uncharacterized protein LOC103180135 isoform X1 [Callorhinchus milii]|eukprot:gi/632956498/ref/XP_007893986.1/ PREDICTED: tyrosine-protein phosphatase non-receptor type substrate 1-like isoform X1 [Callorhinchus milii]